MRRFSALILLITLPVTHACGDNGTDSEIQQQAIKILSENCLKCHGEDKKSGKLDARTVDALLIGGKRGPAIVTGNADVSRLIELVRPGSKPHMPPGKKQLGNDQIETLVAWINSLPAKINPDEPTTDAESEHGFPDKARLNQPELAADTDSTAVWLPPAGVQPTTVIDLLIQSGYRQRGVRANRRTNDASFIRRLYLDLIGRIPTTDEAHQFLADTSSDKRSELVVRLLASDDYANHMANVFDTMLMGRRERKISERQKHGWRDYLTSTFRDNKPWDIVAREVLLARPESSERGHLWYLYERKNRHQDIAESISKGFFGVDIACAQCHDHPIADEIEQAHYWGLVAFFNRSKNDKSKHGIAMGESAIGGFNEYSNALAGTTDKAVLTFMLAGVVAEPRPKTPEKQEDSDENYIPVKAEPPVPLFSRRQKFVDEVVAGHPFLARAMVNRIWSLLMGRGLVHPPEKMDSKHPPSHPELLDWLAQDFRSDYDIKRLVQSIVNSQAYQLESSIPVNGQPDSFAYGLEKPLSAEAYLKALEIALQCDTNINRLGPTFREQFPEVLPENTETVIKQTLMLSNHPDLLKLLDAAAGQLASTTATTDHLATIYDRIYGRPPTEDERLRIENYLLARQDRPTQAFSQVLWAMVTSAEFRFNH